MKTTTTHSPLPWRADQCNLLDANGSEITDHDGYFTQQDAAYIVRACNAFPKLVASLKAVRAAGQFSTEARAIYCADIAIAALREAGEDA